MTFPPPQRPHSHRRRVTVTERVASGLGSIVVLAFLTLMLLAIIAATIRLGRWALG